MTLKWALTTAMVLVAMTATAQAAPRIVGGGNANIEDVPWQVALLDSSVSDAYDAQFCGGTIRDATHIMTAAHCVEGAAPSQIDVLVGTDRLDGTGTRTTVSGIVIHPDYNFGDPPEYDAALITLSSPITPFPSTVAKPLPLVSGAEMNSLTQGTALTVSGWGTLQSEGTRPHDLQVVAVPLLSDPDCRTAYGQFVDMSAMFCAGVTGKDSCQGDSGGPITAQFGSAVRLVGIVSWGVGCAAPRCPGVYTRVANSSIQNFLTGSSSPPLPPDIGSGEGECLNGPSLPPLQSQPQPRPTFDVTPPTIGVGSKACKKRRCIIRIRVSDAQPSSGLGRMTATVSQKVGKRTRKRSIGVRVVGSDYTVTTPRLRKGRATVRLAISDAAGFRVARNVTLKVK